MSLGERLKEERARLNLTQEALALACNSNKRQQIKYEQGDQAPGAGYLAAACNAGIDVVYVLVGRRNDALPHPERALLSAFRNASPELQQAALAVLGRPSKPAPRGAAGTVIKNSSIGQHVSAGVSQPALTTINVGGPRNK